MELEEAIKHCEEVAEEQVKLCKRYDDASGYSRSHNETIRVDDAKKCEKCAEEHRQLAEWLRDYKRLKEQQPCEDCVSRKAVLEMIEQIQDAGGFIGYNTYSEAFDVVDNMPSATPKRKTGKWIYEPNCWFRCSCCGSHYPHTSIYDSKGSNYCPNCGAQMESEQSLNYVDQDTIMPAT